MKTEHEQIVKALIVIKNECDGNCSGDCYFETAGKCKLRMTSPEDWEINDDNRWKALL